MSASLVEIVVFLAAAVIAVPIAQRLKLGSVLGYLLAGVIIGPWGLGLIGQVDEVLHLAEFGVVFLLFIIGLEMQPRRLWALRKAILGLGGLQVVATSIVLGVAAHWVMGLPFLPATVAGAALALSSTAFALQMLAERGELTSRHGRGAFAILLFQDLAVIPILALLPLLSAGHADISVMGGLIKTAKAAGVIGALVVGGHYVLKPVLRVVAATRMQEIFIATALLIVVGTAAIMEAAGISVALGAFVAGVLLADSEYRHELEADVDPCKDLLLGLFFIAVGMSINLGLFASQPVMLIEMTLGLFAIKAIILFGLARRHGLVFPAARNLAAYLGQGGEFAFVILSTAVAHHLFVQAEADLLVATVTLSMVITPAAVAAAAAYNRWRAGASKAPEYDTLEESQHPVIIAGFGRVGGIVARMLRAKRIGFVALEANPAQVDFVRRFGARVYYGDASRLEMLRAAHAEEAKVLVVAIGEIETSLRLVHLVQTNFPHLKIVARARDRRHAYRLMDQGVMVFQRETFLSSVALAGDTMRALGLSRDEVETAKTTFRSHDEARLAEHYEVADDEERLARRVREAAAELESLFERDEAEADADDNRANTKRPKG